MRKKQMRIKRKSVCKEKKKLELKSIKRRKELQNIYKKENESVIKKDWWERERKK